MKYLALLDALNNPSHRRKTVSRLLGFLDSGFRRNDGTGVIRSVLLLVFLLFTTSIPVSAKEAAPLAQDPVIEQRMIALSEDLRCLVCQNESLAGSQADLANDLRREIREQMKQGKSDKEIIDFLVQRYGDFVLYRPPVKSYTLLLWFGPFILLLAGAGTLVIYLNRRRKRVGDAEIPLSEEQKKQAENLLKQGDNNS